MTKILKGHRKEMKDEMKKHSVEMKKEIRGIKYLLNHNISCLSMPFLVFTINLH